MIRIFSMTLPAHESNLPAKEAMKIWAEEMGKGVDRIDPFLMDIQRAVDFAVSEKFADPSKMAAAGLSRGAMIAAHVAARDERFKHIVGFAPLTKLRLIREFQEIQNNNIVNGFDLIHLAPALADRHIKLFIGNEDTRVGTRACFDFAMALVEKKKTKISHTELVIYPSIGQMGHGTPPEIFKNGANWISSHLKPI